jgi:hypothetical protein
VSKRLTLTSRTSADLFFGLVGDGYQNQAGPLYKRLEVLELVRRLNQRPSGFDLGPVDRMLAQTERFNREIIDLPIPDQPTRLGPVRKDAAIAHLYEELIEFKQAETIDEEVDALIDLAYVALGRLIEMGIAPGPVFDEVHDANMRRVKGDNPSRRPGAVGFDAVKPEDWEPPNLGPYLTLRKSDVLGHAVMSGRFNCRGDYILGHPFTQDRYFASRPSPEVHTQKSSPEMESVLKAGRHKKWLTAMDSRVRPTHSFMQDAMQRLLGKFGQVTDESETISNPDDLFPPTIPTTLLTAGKAPTGEEALDAMERLVTEQETYRILVVGHGRHGKDTVCELLRDKYGMRFTSSSAFCAEHVVYPMLADKYNYLSASECYEDRHNHRAEWFDIISEANRKDPTTVARAILKEHDVYCGIRSARELHACHAAGLFDLILWVDASMRVPPEDASSCTVEPWMAHYVLDNNGTLEDLEHNLDILLTTIGMAH